MPEWTELLNPDETDKLLSLAQQLTTLDYSGQSQIRYTLRRKLLTSDKHSSHWKVSRRWLTTGVWVVVLMLLMVTPLRLLAQEIIQQIGSIIITNGPTEAQQRLDQIESGASLLPSSTPVHIESYYTIEDTSAAAGFPVYQPSANYPLQQCNVFYVNPRAVICGYDTPQYRNVLVISQAVAAENAAPQTLAVGTAPVVDVTVQGQPGVWVEQWAGILNTGLAAEQDEQIETINLLLWADDDFVFTIQSPELSMNDMLQIAEELAEIQAPVVLSIEDASAAAGFPVYAPADLPDDYILGQREVLMKDGESFVHTRYKQKINQAPLELLQIPVQSALAAQFQAIRESGTTIQIGDQSGIRLDMWDGQAWNIQNARTLIWESDGFIFVLQAPMLNQNTLIRLAKSIS